MGMTSLHRYICPGCAALVLVVVNICDVKHNDVENKGVCAALMYKNLGSICPCVFMCVVAALHGP